MPLTNLYHRYEVSPKFKKTKDLIDSVFCNPGYDPEYKSVDYKEVTAALGIIWLTNDYGWNDGSNEKYFYKYFEPVNQPLILKIQVQRKKDPNRWQPSI